jgi:hypothetical protein
MIYNPYFNRKRTWKQKLLVIPKAIAIPFLLIVHFTLRFILNIFQICKWVHSLFTNAPIKTVDLDCYYFVRGKRISKFDLIKNDNTTTKK